MKRLKVAFAALLFACSLLVQAGTNPSDQLPMSPLVKTGKLPNGLTYYIQKNSKPQEKAELRLVVKAGSILEDDDQLGLAHFTEHMAFNGSTHFKRHELISWLQSIGVKFGADLNAYTGYNETVYMLPIPVTKKENLDKGLLVLEDMAGGVLFNDADVDSERNIVLEELRLGKGAADRMNKILMPKLFNGSRYASRDPAGKAEVLRSFKPEVIRRFYRDWYRPNLMAVMVVGDIDPAETEQLIVSHFSKLKNPPGERPRLPTPVPPREKSDVVVVTDREARSNSLNIRYPIQPRQEGTTLGDYREKLVENLSAMMLNQRMVELTQQPNPPYIQGGSSVDRSIPGYSGFASIAVLGKGGAIPAIDALVQEGQRARRFGFTAPELERAKKGMLRSVERLYIERDKSDSTYFVNEMVRHFLVGESMPGVENEYGYVKDMLPQITLEEVNAQVRNAIPDAQNKLVIYAGNDKSEAPIPKPTELLAAVEAAEKAELTAREDKAYDKPLMDKPPKAGRIVKETHNKALGTTELMLSNGVRVVLKPTDFRNDQVLLGASRFGGQSLVDEADIFNARYTGAVVSLMGLRDYTPLELQKVLAGKAASAGISFGMYTENIAGSSGSTDVETMLQLVYLQMTAPRKDPELFHSYIDKQQELARGNTARPESMMADTVRATLFGNHPRIAQVPRPEEFDGLSLDRMMALYKERFGSARGMTFFLVGSFELDKIKPLVAAYIGGLPVRELAVGYKDRNVHPVRGVVKKDVRRGRESKATINLTFTGDAPFSDVEQTRLSALVEVLNIKLTEVLREQKGLIYGGGASGSLARHPRGMYTLTLALPCGPENVDKVLEATFAEVRKLQDNGPEAGDLAKVKENWANNNRRSIRENSYWLNALQAAHLNGLDPNQILKHAERLEGLKAADVQAAARRYFDFNNYLQVVLYPDHVAEPAKQP